MKESESESLAGRIINRSTLASSTRVLRIPLEDLDEPATKQFVITLNVAHNLLENLGRAASLNSIAPDRYFRYGYLPSDGEHLPQPEGVAPALEQRYAAALHLGQALVELISEGFGDDFRGARSWCKWEIEDALSPYGMTVGFGAEPRPATNTELAIEQQAYQELGDVQQRFSQAAERLEIPQESWKEPAIHQYLGIVLGTENLLIHAQNGWQSTAVKPSCGPAILDRFRTTQGFAQAMLAVLEDGRGGRNPTADFLEQTLNPALAPYELHIAKATI